MRKGDTNSLLAKAFDGLQGDIKGDLSSTRVAVSHSGARGEGTEDGWRNILERYLPQRYKVDKAFVIDSKGDSSDEIDLVIYDRQYSPYLYHKMKNRYVPAECVYAVLEVKQEISKEDIIYAGKKAASVRCLCRTSEGIRHIDGFSKGRTPFRIIAGILAFKSSWERGEFGDALVRALGDLNENERLDIGCALETGTFEVNSSSNPEVLFNKDVTAKRWSFIEFLLCLLKQLQALGTAPAIDYKEYLAWLRGQPSHKSGGGL